MTNTCQACGNGVETGYTLCPRCELGFALLLLGFVPLGRTLHAMLDATLHPGDHQPSQADTSVPPTPIRLDVLDQLDQLDAATQELWRHLRGVDPLNWRRDLCPDLVGCVTDSATHPKLARLGDAGMYVHRFQQLRKRAQALADPPRRLTPVGQCLTCGMTLRADTGQEAFTCATCGRKQPAVQVRLDLLERSMSSGRMFTAAECARLLQTCGYAVSRKTITTWKRRGLLEPAGRDGRGRIVYRLRDVAERLRDTPE